MAKRLQVLRVYKEMLWMGKDWPDGFQKYSQKLHQAFQKNAAITDEHQIEELLKRAHFVQKEIEALYKLKKYRYIKKAYYPEDS